MQEPKWEKYTDEITFTWIKSIREMNGTANEGINNKKESDKRVPLLMWFHWSS